MPLKPGSSNETVSENISEMMHSGHPQPQAVATSLENAGRSNKDQTQPDPASGPMSTKADTERREGLPRTVEPFKAGDAAGTAMTLGDIKANAKRIGRY
jgi:hypothetical protein